MKNMRYLGAILLLLTGVLHLLPLIMEPEQPGILRMVAFGIAFSVTGVLLLLDKKIAPILGVVFPLIGLSGGFLVIGIKNWTSMLTIMFVIDAAIIVCCSLLLSMKNKARLEVE